MIYDKKSNTWSEVKVFIGDKEIKAIESQKTIITVTHPIKKGTITEIII